MGQWLVFMKGFKVLDHTADLKMEFFGKNFEELLNNCAKGLSVYLYEKKGKKFFVEHKIKFKKKEEIDFLINFLNEILYLMQYKNFIPSKVELNEEDNEYLINIIGEKTDLKPIVEIKAATYHNANIENVGNNLKAIVTFDL